VSDNKFVTADAQFGNATILRPYAGFEAAYQGKSGAIPIMWSPGGVALDDQAGKPGYSARLAKGMRVPFGSRVVLWFPMIFPATSIAYRWAISWRLRNLYDFRTSRAPYHLPKQSNGDESHLASDLGVRVVLPAARQTVPYQQAQPALAGSFADVKIYQEGIRLDMPLTRERLPILNAAGDVTPISQGIFDPNAPPLFTSADIVRSPLFQIYETQATGDEMLLMMTTGEEQGVTWGFVPGQGDLMLSQYMAASASVGVYAFVGSAP
jgi:hypothetical protein